MKELTIFGRLHQYDFSFEINNDIRVIEELLKEIKNPQILSYCGMEDVDFYIKGDNNFICNDCIHWIYEQNKERLNEKDIRECLLKCATEDVSWTEERNKGLTGIFYRKITFLPEIQDMVYKKLNEYIQQLNNLYREFEDEKQKEKEERNRQKNEWTITHTFKKVLPRGGENGRDGYVDAEYISNSGETIRMVSRDVFDFGCYSYPKRLEGSEDIFNRDLWTESEIQLTKWLAKFGEFHGIRM